MLYIYFIFFFNDTATTEIYTLSLHDRSSDLSGRCPRRRRSSTSTTSPRSSAGRTSTARRARCTASSRRARAWRSEEHTSELQSRQYLVCRLLLEKKNK